MSQLSQHQLDILQLHLHPTDGSPHWIRVARDRGVRARDLQSTQDLARLGVFDIDALRREPVEDFVPRALRGEDLLPCCTGGATAIPAWTVFTPAEFDLAFVRPFAKACAWSGFPQGGRWLFLGPTGSHPIGRAAVASARACGAGAPFAIDLDPRWARSLAAGSFARERYLEHIVRQASEIIAAQDITVIFATPPILARLSVTLPPAARERVLGIHHGGTSVSAEELSELAAGFPHAVFLGGYGNSLLGMSPEVPAGTKGSTAGAHLRYATDGERIRFRVVDGAARAALESGKPPAEVAFGERGRLLVDRFDTSTLICNHLERDEATSLPPTPVALDHGMHGVTLGAPRTFEGVTRIGGEGLY